MNTKYQQQTKRILQKLQRAKKTDANLEVFGASRHQYEVNKPLPLSEVEAFEEKYGVVLPDCYRSFVLQVGNGGISNDNSGAGPFYGIYPLGAEVDCFLDNPKAHLKNDCTLKPNISVEEWELPDDIENDAYDLEMSKKYYKGIQDTLEQVNKPKPIRLKITKKEYEEKLNQIYNNYFDKIKEDPLKIHRTAASWNWDYGFDDLFEIATNKNTDIGTAIMLFWHGQPFDFWCPFKFKKDASDKPLFRLLDTLHKNCTSNFYQKGAVKYNPKKDNGTDWTQTEKQDFQNNIDNILFEETQGKKIKDTYHEGFPDGVWHKIEKIEAKFYY